VLKDCFILFQQSAYEHEVGLPNNPLTVIFLQGKPTNTTSAKPKNENPTTQVSTDFANFCIWLVRLEFPEYLISNLANCMV
jgi:hypothetical protein